MRTSCRIERRLRRYCMTNSVICIKITCVTKAGSLEDGGPNLVCQDSNKSLFLTLLLNKHCVIKLNLRSLYIHKLNFCTEHT